MEKLKAQLDELVERLEDPAGLRFIPCHPIHTDWDTPKRR
jgi:hypothetical protein